ncbi:class I SAM-dependent methyltransferase [Hyphomonas sp.]|uniref:class I SAM-dependent methyltransferase n=1 Tax=Hyphomonas sp. TaxID=87 RepID=UPI0039199928
MNTATQPDLQAIVTSPRVDFDPRLDGENVYASAFGALSIEQWIDVLVRSIDERVIDGVEFPSFPPREMQSSIHGHFGEHSIREAARFYTLIRDNGLTGPAAPWHGTGYLLDFGMGWGRITRPFLRDFPLRNIVGYEPSNRFASVARSCNPYVSILSGGYMPDGIIPPDRFDLVVGWSVFSHLSLKSASAWLAEMQRVTRPGAAIVLTTWGMRFLQRLKAEKAQLDAGQEIHWYSKVCLDTCGNIDERIEAYKRGEFVWFNGGNSDLYGEAFLGEGSLRKILAEHAPKLRLARFDTASLPQDVFILRRGE